LTSFFRELTFAVHGVDGAGEGGPAGRKPASIDPDPSENKFTDY
jgi:hypothetical protein